LLFNSYIYLVFLPSVVLLYWLMPKDFRKTLLLVASYVFYMHWMPAYGLLLLILTLVNYGLGLLIARSERAAGAKIMARMSVRKALLIAGLIFNLGCLCFFKYTNFLVDSFFQSAKFITPFVGINALNTSQSPALQIILPLGISFFTFEFIHYITDVYRGSQPIRNIRDFALFAGFFPSQIAGPIKRFQDFVQQLNKESAFVAANFSHGLFLILQGLFKKIVLGDNLGLLVNAGYQNVQALGTADAWIAVVAFALQLFFDFSGYTDIGRGSALLLGYSVPENFNWPYLAASLTEFWHRWHMSLSTWLRDYLYIPLGGSRGSVWQARRNTFLTMVLGGLWHGASWNFVIWGALHGAGLVLSKDWHQLVSKFPVLARLRPHPIWHFSGVALTLFFWIMTGIFFRANDLPSALAMSQKLVHAGPSGAVTNLFALSTLPFTLCLYAIFCICRSAEHRVDKSEAPTLIKEAYAWMRSSLPVKVVSFAAAALVILGFAPAQTVPFIYFQF
jgi:alginate O-acetyltransferase complex protein AlgI